MSAVRVGSFTGVCRLALLYGIQAVQCDAPFEGERQQHPAQRLRQGVQPPFLVPSDPHDAESEIVVDTDDIRVHVVSVVVGVPPLRRETGHVPLPYIGMDLRIVHPIPLTVGDVMAELHVLDALGRGQGGGSNRPAALAFAPGDH